MRAVAHFAAADNRGLAEMIARPFSLANNNCSPLLTPPVLSAAVAQCPGNGVLSTRTVAIVRDYGYYGRPNGTSRQLHHSNGYEKIR